MTRPLAPSGGLQPMVPSAVEHLALYRSDVDRDPAAGVLVCVHGSLDRGGSFARIARRVDGPRVVTYDRRGYQGSRDLGATSNIEDHVDDLIAVIDAVSGDGPVGVLGHSFGGVISLRAALRAPEAIDLLVVYEPPTPWLSSEPEPPNRPPLSTDPALAVQQFFSRLVSPGAWERLSDAERAERGLDGPALVGDISIVHQARPFSFDDLSTLAMPLTIGVGTATTMTHHAATARRIAESAPDGRLVEVEHAGHGAHLSHPDALAAVIDEAWDHAATREEAPR